MKKLLLIVFCVIWGDSISQSNTLQQLYVSAIQAHQNGKETEYYELIMKAYNINPRHQGILYQAGIAANLNHKSEEAIDFLTQAIRIQADFALNIPELRNLKGNSDYEQLLSLQKKLNESVITSDTAYLVTDRTLHLEGIDVNPLTNILYASSIRNRKIIQIKNGKISDFIREEQDGIPAVFGVRTDEKYLWACASPTPEMIHYDLSIPSGVYQYELEKGKLIKIYSPKNTYLNYIFGDLTIDHKNEVYVSDSRNNFIFHVNKKTGELDQFYSSEVFTNIQGITFSEKGEFLFIADYIKGIFRLDMKTMRLESLNNKTTMSTKGIDGLIYYKQSLITIQNGVKPMRVVRFKLNDSMEDLTSYLVTDQHHPAFHEPTNGSISNNTLYYIANSQWEGYTENHQPQPTEQLEDIVILKQKLDYCSSCD